MGAAGPPGPAARAGPGQACGKPSGRDSVSQLGAQSLLSTQPLSTQSSKILGLTARPALRPARGPVTVGVGERPATPGPWPVTRAVGLLVRPSVTEMNSTGRATAPGLNLFAYLANLASRMRSSLTRDGSDSSRLA